MFCHNIIIIFCALLLYCDFFPAATTEVSKYIPAEKFCFTARLILLFYKKSCEIVPSFPTAFSCVLKKIHLPQVSVYGFKTRLLKNISPPAGCCPGKFSPSVLHLKNLKNNPPETFTISGGFSISKNLFKRTNKAQNHNHKNQHMRLIFIPRPAPTGARNRGYRRWFRQEPSGVSRGTGSPWKRVDFSTRLNRRRPSQPPAVLCCIFGNRILIPPCSRRKHPPRRMLRCRKQHCRRLRSRKRRSQRLRHFPQPVPRHKRWYRPLPFRG